MKSVINSFGDEWIRFDQDKFLSNSERKSQFLRYFNTPHFEKLKSFESIKAIDVGAGSGRWSKEIFNHLRISRLTLIEPSESFMQLKNIFYKNNKVKLIRSSIDNLLDDYPYLKGSFNLVYCFGVLHHTNSIEENFSKICNLVEPNGIIFCYLYYNLDNRNFIYKALFLLTIIPRTIISRLPNKLKNIICDFIAIFVYLPFIKLAKIFPKNNNMPLHGYIDRSFFSIRTDSRDRFGTKIERRISKKKIMELCKKNSLKEIYFSEKYPFWVFSAMKHS
tara:strand:- start:24 stop:854 length:831 start_codon:yes stop_codon:yes gene_type:complete